MIQKLAKDTLAAIERALKAGEADIEKYLHSFRAQANSIDPDLKDAIEAGAKKLGAAAVTLAKDLGADAIKEVEKLGTAVKAEIHDLTAPATAGQAPVTPAAPAAIVKPSDGEF